MSEHRTTEIRTLLSEVDKKIKEMEARAYIDPVKAEEAKEKGNDLFKQGKEVINFPSSILFSYLPYQVRNFSCCTLFIF